jgi:hypothetical protein
MGKCKSRSQDDRDQSKRGKRTKPIQRCASHEGLPNWS